MYMYAFEEAEREATPAYAYVHVHGRVHMHMYMYAFEEAEREATQKDEADHAGDHGDDGGCGVERDEHIGSGDEEHQGGEGDADDGRDHGEVHEGGEHIVKEPEARRVHAADVRALRLDEGLPPVEVWA